MSHQLILDVPGDVYGSLAENAKNRGMTLEQLALELLADAASDPIEKHIGAFKSNVPDWADQHDKYLGEELLNTHDEAKPGK